MPPARQKKLSRVLSPWIPKPETHVYEPAHGTCNTLRKFLDRDRVVRWGLVPSHNLTTPFAVSGPLKKV